MIPMGRPLLPPVETLMPYLKRIDESRWYSNGGALLREYEERIAQLFGCYAAATGSGTAGLTAALRAQDIEGEIFMPSWTFVATANAVRAAGCDPHFVDVDEETWTPEHADVAVAPFGAPVEYEDAVMIDGAAAFDAYALKLKPIGATPVVISTHCTKTFSTGEGGLVLSQDKDLIHAVRCLLNHGIDDNRDVPRTGINGKLSEYGAAIGMAELDNWAWKRSKWLDTKRKYVEAFGELSQTTPFSSLRWVGSTFCIRTRGRDAQPVRDRLQASGVMSRRIWGDGVHRYAAYAECERDKLPVTEALARETVFVPFSIDTTNAELETIVKATEEALLCD